MRSFAFVLFVIIAACSGEDPPATMCTVAADCPFSTFCAPLECLPGDPRADSFGCVRGASPCAADEICVEVNDTCTDRCSLRADSDGDTYDAPACGGNDCNDDDGLIYPGADEQCDGVDDNCNGQIDDSCS